MEGSVVLMFPIWTMGRNYGLAEGKVKGGGELRRSKGSISNAAGFSGRIDRYSPALFRFNIFKCDLNPVVSIIIYFEGGYERLL